MSHRLFRRLTVARPGRRSDRSRVIAFEPLEPRLALTTFTVNSLTDGPVNFTDNVVTLRDAITAANNNVAAFPGGPVGGNLGSDGIVFEAGLTGIIGLTQGELTIRSSLSITGPSDGLVQVRGLNISRVFNVSNAMPSRIFASIRNLVISFGAAPGSLGGAILNRESLTLDNCFVAASHAAKGAGIYNADTGSLNIINSKINSNTSDATTADDGGSALYNLGTATIRGTTLNSNRGTGGHGPVANLSGGTLTMEDCEVLDNFQNTLTGGVENAGTLTLRRTTIANNTSQSGIVGGVSNGGVATLLDCTISENEESSVGGVANSGTMTILNCTISGNTGSFVGGVYNSGTLRLQNSTISGNTLGAPTGGSGAGGVYNDSGAESLIVANSTITLNRALGSTTGGLRNESNLETVILNSIITGNFEGSGSVRNDVYVTFAVSDISANNIVGVAGFFFELGISNGSNGNQVGVLDAKLGPLANNGGHTETHALLAGSPAINAGFNGAIPLDLLDLDADGLTTGDQLPFDGRDFAFNRIIGGVVDIGAFESGAASADFDLDRDVDGADFLAWQRGLGSTGAAATSTQGNADIDNDVDGVDLAVWKTQFGSDAIPAVATDVGAIAPAAAARSEAMDAAMAFFTQSTSSTSDDETTLPWFRPSARRRRPR